MAHTTAGQFESGLMIITIMSLSFGISTLAQAAPIRQGTNAEASCETVRSDLPNGLI